MHLRPYQSDITSEVRLWWELGHKVVCVQLSTGGGKTPILSDLINNHGGFVCAIAHRDRLVEQISLTLAKAGIRHDLICSDRSKKLIAKKHVRKLGQCFYVPGARCRVASIDTLVRAKGIDKWAAQVTLWVVDEAHHLLRANKWGRGLEHFTHPQCHGLMLTATPGRPDRKGLGRHRKGCNGGPCEGCGDGLADALVIGPPMRWLIDEGYLCDYDVVCPPTDLVAAEAPRGSDGDLTRDQVREAERASHIVGDIPSHYLEWAKGLSGVTFVGSIETATDVVRSFRERGVPAELITGDTDPTVRDHIFEKAESGEIKQIVAVDVISEGVDCLDADTEILTPDGWKGFADIGPGDSCYSLNTTTGGMEITPIEAARERPARTNEKVWTVRSQHTNIRVTEGHVIHHQNKHPRKPGGRGGEWLTRTAREIHERQQPFVIPLAAEGCFAGLPLSLDEMHFLGWFLSDGYLSTARGRMTLSQSKPEGIAQIKALLARLGWDYTTRTRHIVSGFGTARPSVEFRIPKGGRGGSLARKGWGHLALFALPDKQIPKSYFDMTREQFSYLWKGLMEGDGSNFEGKRSGSLTCGRKDHMEALTHLAITRGFAASYGTYRSASGTEIFNIRVRDSKWMTLQPKDSRGAKYDMRPANPDERFWCVKNRNGTLVTRRHGKMVILGNCPTLQVGSFGRLTCSPIVWLQQVGRILRPLYAPGFDLATRMGRLAAIAASKKPKALLIDHIGGFINPALGPPDKPRVWSLEPGESRQAAADPDDIPNRVCLNPDPLPSGRRCFAPYPRTMRRCPKCGWHPEPASRAAPEHVDGDLQLMDPDALAILQGRVIPTDMDRTTHDAQQLAKGARPEWIGRHWRNYEATSTAQLELRDAMDRWAGRLHAAGRADYEIQRAFYLGYAIDVVSAQGLNAADATVLKLRIDGAVNGR